MAAERFTGASVRRSEDPRILSGKGRYVDDVMVPGALHAAFVRSPLAHGHITAVDTSAAAEMDGVVAVFDGHAMRELVPDNCGPIGLVLGMGGVEYSLLATDKVRVVGDPIVMVVAETRAQAEDAVEMVEVDYEELDPIARYEHALDPDGPPIFESVGSNVLLQMPATEFGPVEETFARADRVLQVRLDQHRHQNMPMECRGIVASWDERAQHLEVTVATQGVSMTQKVMSASLGLEDDQVTVFAGDVGGSFGLKIGGGREEVATAAAAKALGRPVKWTEDRNEHLVLSGQAREERFDVEVAITDAGDILGLKVDMVIDTGAYPGMGGGIPFMVQGMIPGPYRLEALSFASTSIVSNKASYIAYRGPWAAETFVRERVIDIVARELGMEPLEVRQRNVADRRDDPAMVTGRPLTGITAKESLETTAALIDLPAFRRRQREAREQGRYLGLGIATYIEGAPGPRPEGGALGAEAMKARLEDDGTVTIFTPQMPHGQGHETTLAQIAADEFGVDFTQVRVVVGDSTQVPAGFGTGGSRSATMAGGASLTAARALRARVLDVAGHLLEAHPDDLQIADGSVAVKGVPTSSRTLAEIATAARAGGLPDDVDADLEVTSIYDGGQGGWSGGTHAAIVEVDVETGQVRFERYVVTEDCGALINPAIVDGQVRGGVAQGIGAVLLERSAYSDDGNYQSATMMDYLLPTAVEIPPIEIHHLETVPLDPDVNFRGVGEGGMIVAPATVCNAIEDALEPFGVRITEQHLPPTRILELIGVIEPE